MLHGISLSRLLFGLAAFCFLAAATLPIASASARDLSVGERGSLSRAVARFDAAMRRQNIPVIIDVVPPKVVSHIAAQHGVDPTRLRRVMIAQTREIIKSSVIRAFRMDLARARYGATSNGTPYALIPTSTTIRVGGQDSTKSSNTLAMMDGGRWYLLDLNQPSRVAIFTQVYPEFRGVPLGGLSI